MRNRKLRVGMTLLLGLTAAAWATDMPRKSPDLEIQMVAGKNLQLSHYRGKVVALAFISTMCPHCQHLTQVLNGIQTDYGSRGVQVLVSAYNDGAQGLLPEFIKQYQPRFPVGWNDQATVLSFMQLSIMNPGFVPKVVFIDGNGLIRQEHPGRDGNDPFFTDVDQHIRATLDGLLKAAPARKTVSSKK
jgi:peroxiredoxin